MKIESAKLRASAKGLEECPSSNLPEFAFIGRSNVGKSSLINALTECKELAHTSSKPGKTQRINLFTVNDSWTLVDLPGYGYAKLSREKQGEFNREVSAYLTERENLKQVMLLVDSQIEPQGGDLSFALWLQECGVPYSVVFTKTDRGSDSKTANHSGQFRAELEAYGLEPNKIFMSSAKTKKGRGQILQWIEQQLPKKPKKKKGTAINLKWMK
ncbi:ribosome biogenesis GTP-binding protein YihA/YsxC [Coraliomargarita sinensis]|nr:ribosome biogenesis GTP-binding protein YihA/YsxC [Coraliomargarita sinensis]